MKHLKRFNENTDPTLQFKSAGLDKGSESNRQAADRMYAEIDRIANSGSDTALHDLFYTTDHIEEFMQHFGYVPTGDRTQDEVWDELGMLIADSMRPLIRRAMGSPNYPSRQHQRPNIAFTHKYSDKFVPSWKK
jgi:hypothetical protein